METRAKEQMAFRFAGDNRQDFEDWKIIHGEDEASIEKFMETAADKLQLMLRAARECGSPNNRLPALKLAFDDWCWNAVKTFRLERSLNVILKRERAYTDKLTMSYQDWRKECAADLRYKYDFKDNPRKSDDDLLTLETKSWPLWGRGGGLQSQPGNIKRVHLRLL